jgi:hypothetical protein
MKQSKVFKKISKIVFDKKNKILWATNLKYRKQLNQAIAGFKYASVKIQDGEALVANLQSQLAL